MAMDEKRSKEIIARLDSLILQQEDRPEVYSMQRMARHLDSIDITTTGILTKLNDVYKVNEEMKEQSKTLFDRISERWDNASNKVRASISNLADIIKTTLDYKGHFKRIQESSQRMYEMVSEKMARMRKSMSDMLIQLVWSSKGMRDIMNRYNLAQKDLQGFLDFGSGNDAPLTVGWVSNLYKKIMTFEMIRDMRNRKIESNRWKETKGFQRNIASDVKRIAKHLVGEVDGWFVKVMLVFAAGLTWFGKQLLVAGQGLSAMNVAFKGKNLQKLNPLLNGFTSALGMAIGSLGKITQGGGEFIKVMVSKSIGQWVWTLVRQVFMGLGRVVTMMMNPVALLTMLAGYSIYKIFEEEFDHLFGGIKAIFANPENRQELISRLSAWFSGLIDGMVDWFLGVGNKLEEVLPVGMFDKLVNGFKGAVGLVKKAFSMYIGGINNIIASFASIPDSFQLFYNAFQGMVLTIKEGFAKMAGWVLSDEKMKEFGLDPEQLAAQRMTLDKESEEIKGRMQERYDTEYVQNATKAAVDTVADAASATKDMVVGIKDNIGSGIRGLGDLAYETAEEMRLKREAERERQLLEIEAEKRLAREVQIEALKAKAAAAVDTVKQSTSNMVNTVVDNSSTANFSTPLTTNSPAKITRTDRGVSQ